ncbi:MAG: hypothetical protein E7632_11740 [Ruminococcaceae bacterium]|nr:hypothetical protein [Oscillospiraceae bacterium]
MTRLSAFRYSEWSLRRRLFVCMLLLAALLLAILASGLILIGSTSSTADIYRNALTMQMAVFRKDISAHFDHLAASAILLSEEMSTIAAKKLPGLTDSPEEIAALQEALLEPLRQKLLQTDCSGAFVVFDATINSAIADSDRSRTGLYLQISGYHPAKPEVLLYRGMSDIA